MQGSFLEPPLASGDIDPGRFAAICARFGERSKAVLGRARDEAYRYAGNYYLGTGHLLLGLVADDTDPIARALAIHGSGPEAIRAQTERIVGPAEPSRPRHLVYTTNAKSVLTTAVQRADASATGDPEPRHLWWALSRYYQSIAGQILFELNLTSYLQQAIARTAP